MDGFACRHCRHQLDLSYRNLPAQHPAGPVDALHAGDRAPDAPLRDGAGGTVRLHELLRGGPHATILAFGGDRSAAAELAGLAATGATPARIVTITEPGSAVQPGEFADLDGHAHRAYGAAEGTRVVIRPDGYVGFLRR
ncbi:hypothetical protein [Nocardia huaxiensis]|uniref:aromatic-ring hydroxylase C-terminal domain-containing protein n=1 Tax=Nocardia huaxiensis TaxID=2755382 RepID=UPI001E522B25|nr:hypothetical protein [Nocardia huaxiensis]UFS97560.1 hypothetical protein LPY97_06535 [Nocardia huaxiensis]